MSRKSDQCINSYYKKNMKKHSSRLSKLHSFTLVLKQISLISLNEKLSDN